LFVFRSGFDTTIIAEKSKNLGVDLYWIGIMIWGGIIISENKHVRFVEIFKNNPQPRILIIIALIIGAILITVLKRTEEKSAKETPGIFKIWQNLWISTLLLIMICLGVANFSLAFYMMGLSQI
jgi:hypothetical protein